MTNNLFQPPSGEANKHAYHSFFEKKLIAFLPRFDNFIDSQTIAGTFLFFTTIVALIWATVPSWASTHHDLVHTPMGFHLGEFQFSKTLQFWTNDVLLTLFFFVIGLEVKREFLVGELIDRQRATTVFVAALGGMLVPALIYAAFNYGESTQHGWGIPMATDTAFALGILALFARSMPRGIFAFLAALAVVDDIGAIIVIGFFYSYDVNLNVLLLASALMIVLMLFNFSGVRKAWPYLIVGIGIWICVELGNIHGTVAGIAVAFTIPARPAKGPRQFLRRTRDLLNFFESREQYRPLILEDEAQHKIVEAVLQTAQEAMTPLQRWQSALSAHNAFFILPLFALLNAGIAIDIGLLGDLFKQPISLGILSGLVIGKPLGIFFFTYLSLKLRIGRLPSGLNLKHVLCVGMLGGMGFTMSIFMATLGLDDARLILMSKAAILLSSLIAAVFGALGIFYLAKMKHVTVAQ